MKLILTLLAASVLTACQPDSSSSEQNNNTASTQAPVIQKTEQAQQSETQRLNEWFAIKYEEQLQMSPMRLTFLGRKTKYDQIDDMSEAAEKKQLAWQKQTVDELSNKFDYQLLDVEGKISYDIWVYQYEQAAAGQAFNKNAYIFTQFNGIQSFAAQFLINFHKVEEESDMSAYNKRITGIANAIDQLLVRAKENASAGVRPPRFAYQGVIAEAKGLIAGAPFTDSEIDSPLWSDAKRKVASLLDSSKIDQAKADELKANAKAALLNDFLPSYKALAAWFEADIVNTDEIARGVSSHPNGDAFYDHQLAASTTTELTADEIHNIGLSEVSRITTEMLKIKDKVGFEGDLQDFFTFIKTDKQFFFSNTDEGRQGYIDETEAHLAEINKKLPEFFGVLPKAKLVVKRVEAFREQDGAAQHYFPGTPDGSRPGVYYAHLSDMSAMPKNEMEGVAYHEGNPGHHMQISIAQELTSVPQFRTQANFTAYSEGWGLYAELLAKEMGGYQNDFSDFGRLVNEMWRAVRLVVDTGLHSKGWTEEEAIAYFKEKTPIAEEAIVSEVRRYLVLPGQATAYKVGMLKIMELRATAEKTLGDKFDIKGFHDTVLGGGAMPLSILERRIKAWIDTQKAI
ncbi:DUF885 domain-containing protein [Thalassotalea profundi]|uniref:DUF885 domain-containing protein n=1 Tax=Thalassotalea profundi TaxID=2036687 RepID=A0ABQ3IJN1_9GAMM|nr:DUF885 domain-containing protein [Thalassotalea profundi]GHE85695.1 hypothetical protein GCM10011501_13490 [Thalassotalea profundi]